MKKVVRTRVYDTDEAEKVGYRYEGSFGDPAGYSEELFKTAEGFYFLFTAGGEDSPYTEEKIKPMSAANAEKWLAEYAK